MVMGKLRCLNTEQTGRKRTKAMAVRIYHNPRCTKSRQTLELLKAKGITPEVIEYLKTPLDTSTLKALNAKLGVPVRAMMRTKEAPYQDLGLAEADDTALLAAIVAHPILLERPIVENGLKAAIGRPPEAVETVL
jgi:arsenate reductase